MTLRRGVWGAVARRFGRVAFWSALSRAAQRGALCRHDWPTVAQKQKGRRGLNRAGWEGGMRWMLLVERSPLSDLKDSILWPAFFSEPAIMPRTVCFSQWKVRASSSKVAPFFRLSIAIIWAILLPSRGPPPSFALAVFLALGAFLVAVPLAGAPLADCARLVPFFPAFGFAACSACGCSGSPRLLMRSQMRATAALVLLKLSTGVTPVRLLKIET